ncbi:probable G-protein coupled receptor Mth-like 7 isoform X2 [Drosophila simulans]|uniref:probable G-protein coupled receptor Mth-like 7 isoform X2 n=1 Tax=Drosophila simulans TaxID=7240 RepID=UPI00192CFF64|nr:probable G-protein coupled receptor Mth-like 7 isoform X2 [Drosophila simulans]
MKLQLLCTFIFLILLKFQAVNADSNKTEEKSCVKSDNNSNDEDDLWHCIRICCPRKNTMADGGCSFKKHLFLSKLDLSIRLDDNSTEALYFNNQTLLITSFWDIDEMIGLRRDEYTLYKNGTMYLHFDQSSKTKEEYCFYPHQIYSDFPETIWIILHKFSSIDIPGAYGLTSVSLICYIFTIGIYLFVKELRNDFGKCLISCIFCLFLTDLISLMDKLRLLDDFCSLAGYIMHFFDFANSVWFSIISYCIWKKVTSVDSQENRYEFVSYSIFAYGISAIPLGIIFTMNQLWEEDLKKWNWLPSVGFSRCTVEVGKRSAWLYYFGPDAIMNAFNIIMFVLTIRHIIKTKRNIRNLTERPDKNATCVTLNFQWNLLFLRISAIMGVSWVLTFVSMIEVNTTSWDIFCIIIFQIHYGFGIILCVLLICKRSTRQLLITKIRGKNLHQQTVV